MNIHYCCTESLYILCQELLRSWINPNKVLPNKDLCFLNVFVQYDGLMVQTICIAIKCFIKQHQYIQSQND